MTKNKQQTEVDVAELAMKLYPFSNSERNAFITGYNKAKEMEKEQHRVTAEDFYYGNWEYKKFHDYYNETYEGGEQ